MGIQRKHLDELKKLFKSKYGVTFTDEEAREAGENLIRYVEILLDFNHKRLKQFCKEDCPLGHLTHIKLL